MTSAVIYEETLTGDLTDFELLPCGGDISITLSSVSGTISLKEYVDGSWVLLKAFTSATQEICQGALGRKLAISTSGSTGTVIKICKRFNRVS